MKKISVLFQFLLVILLNQISIYTYAFSLYRHHFIPFCSIKSSGINFRGNGGIPPSNSNNFVLYSSKNENESIPRSPSSMSRKAVEDEGISTDSNKENSNPISKYFMTLPEETRDDIKSTALAFVIALFVRLVLLEPRYIPSLSMFPTFDVGDQLLVDKVASKVIRGGYQRRDVVVFNPSGREGAIQLAYGNSPSILFEMFFDSIFIDTYKAMTGNEEALIKRIVGVAGDTIEVKNNKYVTYLFSYSILPT